MDLFLLLLGKILPLYLIIGAGYFAGRRLKVQRESIAALAIYLLVPVVFFCATAQLEVQPEYIFLPFVLYGLCCVVGLGLYALSRRLWGDGRRNLVAYMMGTANQGYFGVPVFLALYGPEYLGLFIFAGIGISLYEATFGYYLLARGSYSMRESFLRLIRLPLLPACLLGFVFSALGGTLPAAALDIYQSFRGAYSVMGMMLIGLGLGSLHHLRADLSFTGFILAGKFLVWPLAAFAMLAIYDTLAPMPVIVYNIFLLVSCLPLAANAVAFATHLKIEPEKAATAVMLSTAIALFYIPLMMGIFAR